MATELALYSVEAGCEPAIVTVLTAELSGVTGLQIVRTRQNVQKQTPRVEVLLTVGAQTEHRRAHASVNPRDEWNAALEFRVITDRKKETVHDDILGRLRVLSLYKNDKFASTPTNHVLSIMKDNGTDHSVDLDADEQETALRFECRIGIRSTSW